LQELIDKDKIQETKWFKSFGRIKDKRITRAFRNLKKRLGAYAQRDGEFVMLSMRCGDKEEAALIVNEMLDLFLASQGSTKREEVAAKLVGLEDRRNRVEGELVAAERALDEVRVRYGFTDLEERNFEDTTTRKLADLELDQSELVVMIRQLQANVETLKKQAVGPITEQIENQVERDPTMVMLTQQIVVQESQLAGRLTRFGENHRMVRQSQELIDELRIRRQIRQQEIAEQTRQSNLQRAQDTLVGLQARLEELEKMRQETVARKRDFDLARIQYAQRLAIRDERKDMLNLIKEQIDKLRIVREDPETPKVQRVGYAPVPLEVSFPRWKIFFPAGTMLGFLLGIGLAFLIELLNDLVRTPRDVGRYLHIPLLGVIPDAAEDEQVRDVDLCHVVRQAPYSLISESYRRFRTNLKLSGSGQSIKALLVSSGMAGDGNTSVVVNLATTFVAEDKKVLLIDTNFRRPSLHKMFPGTQERDEGIEQSDVGLSSLLMGRCGYEEIIRPSGIEGFDVIDAGPLPSNPAELLGSARMQELVKKQREKYDYIVVDGPPILLVSDAKVLTRFVDGTVLVFNAGATTRGVALRTIRELREVNATIVGCVLFAVKAMKGGYFHEQFRSHLEYQKLQLASI
jgi:capsular exopolysaccharide synthesis family protein